MFLLQLVAIFSRPHVLVYIGKTLIGDRLAIFRGGVGIQGCYLASAITSEEGRCLCTLRVRLGCSIEDFVHTPISDLCVIQWGTRLKSVHTKITRPCDAYTKT